MEQNDAISRSDLFSKLMYVKTEAEKKRLKGHLSEYERNNIVAVTDLFAELVEISPALDVAPVVRCGECKWVETCKVIGEYKGKSGFCSRGARMDGEADV